MRDRTTKFAALVIAVVMGLLTLLLQKFIIFSLEENYIFLFDKGHIAEVIACPGGLASSLGSFMSQFFCLAWCGPLVLGVIYGVIALSLCKSVSQEKDKTVTAALSLLPVICLFLCLENNTYKFQGHVAVMMASLSLWFYRRRIWPVRNFVMRALAAILLSLVLYMAAGSVAVAFTVCITIMDVPKWKWGALTGLLSLLAVLAAGEMAYGADAAPTLERALTPLMYYDGSTSFMMLYAWIAMVIFTVAGCAGNIRRVDGRWVAAIIMVAESVALWQLYRTVHNREGYRGQTERYFAKKGDWKSILAIDYGDSPTAWTSYRNLALAHEGKLVETLPRTRPHIAYFMKNRTLTKKEDIQILSDIFYDCDYLGAARRNAFEADLVTRGKFNPYETKKLVNINIAYGDYGVAEKLIAMLEKTLFYRNWAKDRRRFLYDDAMVASDPELSRMRGAIPAENTYLSPKGAVRDLRAIIDGNPSQAIARQFYESYCILTNYHE